MNRELFQQKMQAKLDELKAEVDKLKAKAAMASGGDQLEIGEQVRQLEHKIEEDMAKLSGLVPASQNAWETFKEDAGVSRDSLKSSIHDVAAKFRKQ